MVIQAEVTTPIDPPPEWFYWYATEDDFDEEGNLSLTISTGRLRHRWVPKSKAAAKIYLREHPDALGLRQKATQLYLVRITSLDTEDISEKYPTTGPTGLKGMIIKTPFEFFGGKGDRTGPTYYTMGKTDIIHTGGTKQFKSIQTGIMTDDDILNLSVVEITHPDSFIGDSDNTPMIEGVHDLRMGSNDAGTPCETCGLTRLTEDASNSCPGHFGHISLEIPIPKVMYLGARSKKGEKSSPLLYTLNHICHHCYEISLPTQLLDAVIPKINQQFEAGGRNYRAYANVRTLLNHQFDTHWFRGQRVPCPHCDEYTPEVEFSHIEGEFYIPKPDDRYHDGARSLPYEYVRDILTNIPDDVAHYMGFDPVHARPENMFYGVLPVAPNTVRPEVEIPGKDGLSLNELTTLYIDVVHANNQLRHAIRSGWGESSIKKNTLRLYQAVARITSNTIKGIGSGGTTKVFGYAGTEKNESYKGIMDRLKGKKGRLRNNLQSKYVEDVAYSAVSPDPALSIDQVGVPLLACMKASVEEKVTEKNIEQMREMVSNGALKYPGALGVYLDGNSYNKEASNYKALDQPDTRQTSLDYVAGILEVGSLVKRHVIEGDIGMFNRAPSLHRQSIMTFRVAPRNQKNLSFNPTVCIPFNADYDGDAMKIHFLQKEEAIAEAKKYMALDKNIIHARYGKLTVATDQDQTSGLYLLTHTDKRRRNEWNRSTGLGFTDEGIPYLSKSLAESCYSTVYSENRATGEKRTVTSLPESDTTDGDGNPAYTGRAIFSHLFTILEAEYVSATFKGNTPMVDEDGKIIRDEKGAKIKERVTVKNGKLRSGTLEKDAFGEGGASLAPAFIYHEGYEKGQAKLTEYIELVTRLGFAGHRVIGYTMGVADVAGGPAAQAIIDEQYAKASEEISKIQHAWNTHQLHTLAKDRNDAIFADSDPVTFMEEKVHEITDAFEKEILKPIEDSQGSGNPMQIAVRSKARGKDSNVQQMGGSYGQVMLGGRRLRSGINTDRVLPVYPKGKIDDDGNYVKETDPRYFGFIKSGYSKGMEPDEYWMTSTAGRRSTVESGMGNISVSGYLERKLIKGIESFVVNNKYQVVNLRTNRVVSPIVGEDGLKAWHIRGSHKDVNKAGHTITLQPFFFDFTCKHDLTLAEDCDQCKGSADSGFLDDQIVFLSKNIAIPVSPAARKQVVSSASKRDIPKPTLKKMAKKLVNYYEDSLCRKGEAIGAVAAACMGEPATQAALRTFHFAGKMSFQGSIDRLKQLVESPMAAGTAQHNPRTIYRLKKEHNTKATAEKIADAIRSVQAKQIIKLIEYDLTSSSMLVHFDPQKARLYRIHENLVLKRLKGVLKRSSPPFFKATFSKEGINYNKPLVIHLETDDNRDFLYAKELIMGALVGGITPGVLVYTLPPEKDPRQMGDRWLLDVRYCGDKFLNTVRELLGDYIDYDISETSSISWIYNNYGLEAALWSIVDQIDSQMNGKGGVGEYDWRYVRTIGDIMGEDGTLKGLGPHGLGAFANPSMLGGMSLERQWPVMVGATIMGNLDPLAGVAESVAAGKPPSIGDRAPNGS